MDKKPQNDPRKERLAQQLRANLQRRKEQARERQSDGVGGDTDSPEADEGESGLRDT